MIGGCGVTTPSLHMIAILSGLLGEMWKFESQGMGMSAGSESHGLGEMTVFMKSFMPPRLLLMGPITPGMGSAPAIVEHHPSVGIRNAVGLKPYIPQFAAGLLMLPRGSKQGYDRVRRKAHLQYHSQSPNNYPASRSRLPHHHYFHPPTHSDCTD